MILYMKTIELTQGKFALVDDEDFEELSKHKWHYVHGYAIRTVGRSPSMETIAMHRQIMKAPKGTIVDHKDLNPLNNMRSNLRFATHQDNVHNSKKYSHGVTSKYKGVSWDSHRNMWRSTIVFNEKQIFIGRFDSEIKAAEAYDSKATELFKEFARTNF